MAKYVLLEVMDLVEVVVEEYLLMSLAGMMIPYSRYMGEEVLAAPQMQVLLGHSLMLFLEDL